MSADDVALQQSMYEGTVGKHFSRSLEVALAWSRPVQSYIENTLYTIYYTHSEYKSVATRIIHKTEHSIRTFFTNFNKTTQ